MRQESTSARGSRLDAVEFAGLDERGEDSTVLAAAMRERPQEFLLTVDADKTRLLEFGRCGATSRLKLGKGLFPHRFGNSCMPRCANMRTSRFAPPWFYRMGAGSRAIQSGASEAAVDEA